MSTPIRLLVLLALAACTPDDSKVDDGTDTDTDADTDVTDETDPTADTDTDTDTDRTWDSGETDDTDLPVDTDTDTDTPMGCQADLVATFPADGAIDVYYRPTLQVQFGQDERTTAVFTLTRDLDGSTVATDPPTWAGNGQSGFFTLGAPLQPSEAYTWTVDYSCGGSEDIAFTTGSTGAPVASSDILGKSYAIDLSVGQIVQPTGIGALLQPLLAGAADFPIVIVPDELVGDDLFFYSGTPEDAGGVLTQDVCLPTGDFDGDPANYAGAPFFEQAVAGGLTFSAGGVPITLLDLQLTGDFTVGGASIDGVVLAGTLDIRDALALLPFGQLAALACAAIGLATQGAVTCAACPASAPQGPGDFCLDLQIVDLEAPDRTADINAGAGLVERTPADIAADMDCP